ncbi:hypothetical protein [Streptomyces sp. NPDC001914]|uniref:hypothetical protein n=1 Tax=Streptomyces sp. NPDC001914 TaxID=3364623 RepID=UPI0036BD130D
MQSEDERVEAEAAASQRKALRASLERERDGYKTRGLDDRAAQVEEQLNLLDDDHDQESAEDGEESSESGEESSESGEERMPSAPVERAVESKPRSTAGRARGK